MNIYFVRHGETTLNATRIHQDSTSTLSENGTKHASFLAQRCADLSIDRIIASPFQRTLQTADIIGKAMSLPIQHSPLFVEIKRPTEIEGKSMDAPEVMDVKRAIIERFDDPTYRHSDEETFFALRERAVKAWAYLDTLTHDNVLVVTHAEFLRMLFAVACFADRLEPTMFLDLKKHIEADHARITHFEKTSKGMWMLRSWNT